MQDPNEDSFDLEDIIEQELEEIVKKHPPISERENTRYTPREYDNSFSFAAEPDTKNAKKQSLVWKLIFFMIVLCLSLYLIKSYDLVPSFISEKFKQKKEHGIALLENPALEKKLQRIRNELDNYDKKTITELKLMMDSTIIIVEELDNEVKVREQIITELRHVSNTERKKATIAIAEADSVAQIRDSQRKILQSIITKNANEENEKSFWLGVIISFPIGILASLIASWLFTRKE